MLARGAIANVSGTARYRRPFASGPNSSPGFPDSPWPSPVDAPRRENRMNVCWSLKGGSGTTVVAAGLALVVARRGGRPLLIDLAGDLPAVLGVEGAGPGITDWCSAADGPGPEALERLGVDVPGGTRLVALGTSGWHQAEAERVAALADHLVQCDDPLIVDAGDLGTSRVPDALLDALVGRAARSIFVTRACYLSLRRLPAQVRRPTEVALVVEPGRALGRLDVEAVVGSPVTMRIPLDPSIARAVDSGLLARRVPRSLLRGVREGA